MRIKELAGYVRRYMPQRGVRLSRAQRDRISELVDLIDNAEDSTKDVHWACRNADMPSPKGTFLFFPDAQPTLKEAAQTLVDYIQRNPEASNQATRILTKPIKAALEREDG